MAARDAADDGASSDVDMTSDTAAAVAAASYPVGKDGRLKKPRSAFRLYCNEQYNAVRDELQASGKAAQLGAVQAVLSAQFKELPAEQAGKYHALALKERERYEQAAHARDVAAAAELEKRRRAKTEMPVSGVRKRVQLVQVPKRKKRTKRVLSKEEQERRAAAKAVRDEEKRQRKAEQAERNAELEAQLQDLRRRQAQQQRRRMKYLLGQSEIFQHFISGGNPMESPKKTSKKAAAAGSPSPRRQRRPSAADDEDDGGNVQVVRLMRQPDEIKFGTMRDYQLEGLNWMLALFENGLNGILADEMGLGKTLQTISLLAATYQLHGIKGPHMIIVPKSTLSNWINELKRWCPLLRPLRFHGSKDERAEVAATLLRPGQRPEERQFDVMVTTFEVAIIEKSVLQKWAWQYLVMDEAHRIKNEQSRLSEVVRTFCVAHRLLLTGTPLQNNLHELWSLLNFLLPDVFGSAEAFDRWFDMQSDDDEAKKRMIKQLHRVLRPFMLRRLKKDVAKSIPPKTETILYTGLSKPQKDMYKSILRRDFDAITGAGDRLRLQNIVMQLRKTCNHPYLFDGVEDRSLPPLGEHLIQNCGKLRLLDKLLPRLKSRGSRCLIFSQMTRLLDILEDYCYIRGHQYCRIDGNTSHMVREESIDVFNREGSEKFIFLLSTRAGGLGINLATADIVILYDSDWNPQVDLQAMDRAHRIGQTKPVTVYRLVTAETIEEKIVERAYTKLKLDAVVVQQGRLADKSARLSKQEMTAMVQFGASKVFRATDDEEMTEEDIDAILEAGVRRTEALNKQIDDKAAAAGLTGDLLDFSLDSTNTQMFDGVNYADNKAREAEMERLRTLALMESMSSEMGKRERKAVIRGHQFNSAPNRVKVSPPFKMPRMEDWQFYDRVEIQACYDREYAHARRVARFRESSYGATTKPPPPKYSQDLIDRRNKLLAEGFADWKRNHFYKYLNALRRFGRNALQDIQDAMASSCGKAPEEVARFHEVFWRRGPAVLPSWSKLLEAVERAEARARESKRLEKRVAAKIALCDDNPWDSETLINPFKRLGKGHRDRIFTADDDRALLCMTYLQGLGSWQDIQAYLRTSDRSRFNYYLRSRTTRELKLRTELLMRSCSRDMAAHWIREADRSDRRTEWQKQKAALEKQIADIEAEEKEVQAKLVALTAERQRKLVSLGRSKSKAASKAPELTTSTKAKLARRLVASNGQGVQAFLDSFVTKNSRYSKRLVRSVIETIAVKEKRGADTRPQWYIREAHKQLLDESNMRPTGLRAFPDELLPEFARFIATAGAQGRTSLVNQFLSMHPGPSKRQVLLTLEKVGIKEKRAGGLIRWYIRPAFLKLIEGFDVAANMRKIPTPARTAAAAAASAAAGSAGSASPAPKAAAKVETPSSTNGAAKPASTAGNGEATPDKGDAAGKATNSAGSKSGTAGAKSPAAGGRRRSSGGLRTDLFAAVAQLIGGLGHLSRSVVVKAFRLWHPDTNATQRQVVDVVNKIAVRERRGGGRPRWHLKPEYETLLPDNYDATKILARYTDSPVMQLPEELIPEFLVHVYRSGVSLKDTTVSTFLASHPQLSRRQVEASLTTVASKHRRTDDMYPRWYLRPPYDKMLPKDFDEKSVIRLRGSQAQGELDARYLPALALMLSQAGSAGVSRIATNFRKQCADASRRQIAHAVDMLALKYRRQGDTRDTWYIRDNKLDLLRQGATAAGLDPEAAVRRPPLLPAAPAAATTTTTVIDDDDDADVPRPSGQTTMLQFGVKRKRESSEPAATAGAVSPSAPKRPRHDADAPLPSTSLPSSTTLPVAVPMMTSPAPTPPPAATLVSGGQPPAMPTPSPVAAPPRPSAVPMASSAVSASPVPLSAPPVPLPRTTTPLLAARSPHPPSAADDVPMHRD